MWLWFLKNWKLVGVAVLLGGAFYLGYQVSSAKFQKERAEIAEQTTLAIAAREAEIRAEYEAQAEIDAAARVVLHNDLELLRVRERNLIEGIRAAQLVKPASDLVCEDIEVTDEATVIIANPFTPAFRELWNEAGRPPTTE